MLKYKIANVILEENPRSLQYPSLYCTSTKPVVLDEESGVWSLCGKGTYDFTTFFNALSIAKWRQYTVLEKPFLHLELKGAPFQVKATSARALDHHPRVGEVLAASSVATDSFASFDVEVPFADADVLVGFLVEAEGKITLGECYYYIEVDERLVRPVELALATTTFKKEDFVIPNIELIKREVIGSSDAIAEHFWMHVVDNGSTLDAQALSTDRVFVHPSGNVGGSGGFARGMIVSLEQEVPATHVLLMDDDVAVSPESIKRTYTLLTLLNDEYKDAFISGSMMNFEVGEDQWEDLGFMTDDGRFAPIKPGMRMTLLHDLVRNETFERPAEVEGRTYAAWWYCCIPADTIRREGLPLPVFVRCDDAEYGIRCNPKFITMNGICIWHLSFHSRYSAAVERYQTTRNTLIAQATTGMSPRSDFLAELHNNLRLELKKFNYASAELLLDGFEDYMKGPSFIGEPVAEECFMRSGKKSEKLIPFDELQRQLDLMGIDVDLSTLSEDSVYRDVPRSTSDRLLDLASWNGQKGPFIGKPQGYAVIAAAGWEYPAGKIHQKDILVAVDCYNQKGIIRQRDVTRYNEIMARYKKDMKHYKNNEKRIKAEYAAARERLTSFDFWKKYLGMK